MTDEERSAREAVKAKLAKYANLARERRQLLEELDALERYRGGLKSQNLDGMPRGSSSSDPTSQQALENVSLFGQYTSRLQAICDELTEVEALLQNLEPVERILARYRYIMGLTWDEVCQRMSYSWRQTHRIHSRVLSKLAAEIGGEET